MKNIIFAYILYFSITFCFSHPPFGLSKQQIIKAHITDSRKFSEIKISFGSSYNPAGLQNPNIFHKIADSKPDIFIWLGDLLHLDDYEHTESELLKLRKDPDYMELLKTAHITGIADYGEVDEAGKNRFLYFLDEEFSSGRRYHKGLYTSFWVATQSNYADLKSKYAKIILIDINKVDGEDSISEEQLKWLKNELQDTRSDHFLTVIASVYPILHYDIIEYTSIEVSTKIQLIEMIRGSATPVVLISGSFLYSFGEVIKYPCSQEDIGYPLYEITSAGLNVNSAPLYKEVNKVIDPPTFNNFTDRIFQPNFGELKIRFNHEAENVDLSFEHRDRNNRILLSKNVKIPDKSQFTRREKTNLRCTRDLYSEESLYMALFHHLLALFRDPQFFKQYLVAMVIFLIAIASLIAAGCSMMNQTKKGFNNYDEYEKYHME